MGEAGQALNNPEFLLEIVAGPPFPPELVEQPLGSGLILGDKARRQLRRWVRSVRALGGALRGWWRRQRLTQAPAWLCWGAAARRHCCGWQEWGGGELWQPCHCHSGALTSLAGAPSSPESLTASSSRRRT